MALTVHVDRYDDKNFVAEIDGYDQRRNARHAIPESDWREVERFGKPALYGWSEDKARQYSVPDRQDFGAFVRAKGFKLGVQSSSDHVSTHISYAALYVDKLDREALLQAIRARRTFAATDNVIVDFRVGDNFMGESFSARGAAPIRAFIRGTGAIASVTLVKNNRAIYTKPGNGAEMSFTYTDTEGGAGEAYYYVRVQQQNGQLAWSSPIWVR